MEYEGVIKVREFVNNVMINNDEIEIKTFTKYNMNVELFLNVVSQYQCYNDFKEIGDYLYNVDYLGSEESILEGIKAYKKSKEIYRLLSKLPNWLINELLEIVI